ncbi:hypothetical protein [Nocardioides sp. W7]|uniref:hypothetical protein n=1 Tax=Nocardioides sp. W7 TaxID=2931390 RepID=UPI001FD3459E|nr:hypothetical protein [Nocardioides sp. W7]
MGASSDEESRTGTPESLAHLNRRLHEARQRVADRRTGRGHRDELARAHRELLAALEDFTGALVERGLPVPPALHTELQLHRDLWR